MGNETRSETEQFEYLFLDLEWNQPIGTTELTDRAAVQIAIVAVDEAMNPVKSFSRAIRLRNPESLNPHTVKIIHMPEYNIMQGRSREEVMESVRQTFPAYKHIVVWTRDTYDLFKRDMRECGIAMCRHRVVVLQDVLAVIAGSGQGKIRFEHALQCAEIEYELNYLHHSKHDANYLYQLFTKCYSQYFKLTREEYCDTNIFSGKMHFAKCRYVRKFQPEVILLKPKSSIFMGYTPCKVCACQVEWKRFDWIVLTNIQGKNGINLRNLYPTEKNIEILCKYFHMSYSICDEIVFIRTDFARWIIYLSEGKVSKLLHENYKPSKSEYSKKQKKKCMEGYHKQKLPSQNLYEVLRYIDSHDSSMVKRMAKKSRLEHLFEQVEQEA